LILAAERVARPVHIVVAGILVGALAQGWMGFAHEARWPVLAAFTIFFGVFNFLEARLPAALSKAAPAADRGAAMGVFATCQFLGAACGGALGGVLLGRFGVAGVFGASAAIALAWAYVAASAGNRSSA
jgi:predicted MFS family arabinose efflux permease